MKTDEGKDDAPQALASREVFLDTEVFRRVEFDLANATIVALFEHVKADRLRLHTTDITLREILRQMLAKTDDLTREMSRANDLLGKWKRRLPDGLKGFGKLDRKLDGTALGNEYFASFRNALRAIRTTEHLAASRSAIPIFKAYFERRPPFDGKEYKEFPDAFVIDALEAWCTVEDTQMYVVTHDQAMQRAATASGHLLPLESLQELLEIVTADHAPDVKRAVEAIIEMPDFTAALEDAVDDQIGHLGVVYYGDLADGEAVGVRRNGEVEDLDWSVISSGTGRHGLVLEFNLPIQVDVDFEDRELAFYDKEDDRYYGAENASTEIDSQTALKMFVEIDDLGAIIRSEILSGDIEVTDYHEHYN